MVVNARGLEAISCIATSDSIDYVEPIPITEPIMIVPDVEPVKKTRKVSSVHLFRSYFINIVVYADIFVGETW